MDDFELELKSGFLDEATQGVADVEKCFLELESNPQDAENLNLIFRLAHNLKGSSRAVGFEDLGVFTHQFESFILRVKNNEIAATAAVVSLLLKANDHVKHILETYRADMNARIDSTELINEMAGFNESSSENEQQIETEVIEEPPRPVLKVVSAAQETVAAPSTESVNHESVTEVAAAAPPANELVQTPTPPAPIPEQQVPIDLQPKAAPLAPSSKSQPEESIRVSLSKVENLLNFIGEMVILQGVLREQIANTDSLLLQKTGNQIGKVGKEIQDLAMSLRMLPVRPIFQKMQRIVRDTAIAVKKDVGISLIGEETELDKTVLDAINDPLVHLVRNSVDHGIELPEVRVQRGKPAKGTVTLAAFHSAGKLILEVKDDGGGLDPEKLRKKAIEKGLIKPEAKLTEQESFNLIFAPGFSTKEQVTDVSGRGVGMDVVKTNIRELGGEVAIESVLGHGTTIRITLPLTLAIIDAMILFYRPEKFVLPLAHVHETLRPKPSMVQKTTALGDILLLRGESLPLLRLGDFFGMKATTPIHDMIALVIRTAGEPFAILVDDIIGRQQIVSKPLTPELSQIKGISGLTILGDGKPALILEPTEMKKRKLTLSSIRQEGASA